MFRSGIVQAALGAVALGGTLLIGSAPANAGASTGTWRNGMVAGPYGVGHYGYRPAVGRWHGGYRPYHHGYRSRDNFGAVAAGFVGGLALGALATAPYRYSYPVTYRGYHGPGFYAAPACYTVTRRGVDAWGRLVRVRTQVCD